MADELCNANVAALSYHAGLGDSERSMAQQRWVQEDQCKVLPHVQCTVRVFKKDFYFTWSAPQQYTTL